MNTLKRAFVDGQWDALVHFKLATPRATDPTVQNSALLNATASSPNLDATAVQKLQAPTNPDTVKKVFDIHEQGKTRLEPIKKLSAELCTSCRKPKHYGPCLKPPKYKPDGVPHKQGDFNLSMYGNTPEGRDSESPSTSAHYTSATSDSSLARASSGRPADEQAATGFADLYRHLGITSLADQAVNTTGALSKVSFSLQSSPFEQRGPSVNPYEERLQVKSPPVAQGYVGRQSIDHAFGQIDNVADSTCIDGGGPGTGPAVLG